MENYQEQTMSDFKLTGTRVEVLRHIPYGIHIITTRDSEGLHAASVSWVMQMSFEPTRVAVALRTSSRILQHVLNSEVFALNIMTREQDQMAQAFFHYIHAGFDQNTLNGYRCRPGETACPLFVDAAAWIECQNMCSIEDCGDHTLIIADVVEAGMRPGVFTPLGLWESPWSYGG